MALYKQKGSNVWWYEFQFNGMRYRESAKTTSKQVAGEAMRARRRHVEESFNGITKREMPKLFAAAASEYLQVKKSKVTPATLVIINRTMTHLLPFFGKMLLIDISADHIKKFADSKLAEGVTPRGVNMKLATLRGILRRNHLWERIRPDVSMLRENGNLGKALTPQEETKLIAACAANYSRHLYPAVVLALSTGMRRDEIRLLRWSQISLKEAYLVVGHSKTANGVGRKVPLNKRALATLAEVASRYPDRLPDHYLFPAERYSFGPKSEHVTIYRHNPAKPVHSWRTAWESVRDQSGIRVRFHDLRHTAVSRMLEIGIPLATIASIVGWSASTMYLMANRYGHIGQEAMRNAVAALEGGSKLKASKGRNNPAKPIGVKRQEIEKPAQRKRA